MTSKSIRSPEATQSYNNVQLYWDEAIAHQDLEALIGEPVPCANELEYASFGFVHENLHVTGIHISNKKIRELPPSFSIIDSYPNNHLEFLPVPIRMPLAPWWDIQRLYF